MKLIYLILTIILIKNCLCWKPISGPNAYSLTQSHPQSSILSSHNTNNVLIEPSSSSSRVYHGGNSFLDDNVPGHEERLFSDTLSGIGTKLFGTGIQQQHQQPQHGDGFFQDSCSVDKYAFEHEGTVQYDATLPKLEQFTLCAWMRFTNHSGDHTIFTYSVDDEPREIQLWIANSKGSSFISMAVHGQSLFRLNYPFKMRAWHHGCASWNGKTGEWQLWIKAERVGRGFHNRLVNFKTRPNGIAFSGGPSFTGKTVPQLHSEVTLIQLYKVALSAGKAHRDHKHHHVHHFDHNGPISSTAAPPTPAPQVQQQVNPLLANGQFPSRVRINLAGATNQQMLPVQGLPSQLLAGILPQQNQATIQTQFVNGQYHPGGRLLTEQLLTGNLIQQVSPAPTFTFPGPSTPSYLIGSSVAPTVYSDGNHVQFIDGSSFNSHILYKRNNNQEKSVITSSVTPATIKKIKIIKREIKKVDEKKLNKRGLVMLNDGSLIDDSLLDREPFEFDGLAAFGAPAFKENLTKMMNIEDEIKEHDREPAEGEVQAVMAVCSSCDTEPFQGAVILAWKHLHGRTEHALRAKITGGCGHF